MSTPDMSAFGKYIPGFDFLQNLSRQAAGTLTPGAQSGVSGMPPLSQWVAPTFSVEDLEKRIQELRAVQFWLDQNAKALGATIQALEVQKMTLSALRGMNVKLQDVAEAFKVRPQAAAPAAAAATATAPQPAAAAAEKSADGADKTADAGKPNVDPMQWWGALTQQFQTIASGAVKDMADQAAKAAEHMAQTVQATAKAASKPAAGKSATTPKESDGAKPQRKSTSASAKPKSAATRGAGTAAAPRAATARARKPAAR